MPHRSSPLPVPAPRSGRTLRRAAAGLAVGTAAGVFTGLLQRPAPPAPRTPTGTGRPGAV